MVAEDIIIAPVVTEKSSADMQEGKYTFKVAKKATKVDIKNAVEKYTFYWTPKSTTKIVLFTADNDDIVPSKNSDNLFYFLQKN